MDYLSYLSTQSWANDYACSDYQYDGHSFDYNYGVITLCKKELKPVFNFYDFPSEMNRKLLLTSIYNNQYHIGNVHLESLSNASVRKEQLLKCSEIFNSLPSSNILVCGDFNFDSYQNYNARLNEPLENNNLLSILPTFVDTWSYLKPISEKGFTYDSVLNSMITKRERMRYDRILFNSKSAARDTTNYELDRSKSIVPLSIEMIGTNPIYETSDVDVDISKCITPTKQIHCSKTSNGSIQLFPSDHFGLYTVFELLVIEY